MISLPPAWRGVTITAIADLIFEDICNTARLSASVREAYLQFERGSVPDIIMCLYQLGRRQSPISVLKPSIGSWPAALSTAKTGWAPLV
ncbi:hypothetical protein AGR4B_pAt20353 [Agrobacterium tumefaciens str. CFBP 5621]|nr:hypothetical protein AGR4B_pAt20353 [Agrobacterium tumefaciens str. CFBP 5621]